MYTLKLLLMFKMRSEVHMLFKKKTHKLQILKVYEKKTSSHFLAKAFAEKCVFGVCGYA